MKQALTFALFLALAAVVAIGANHILAQTATQEQEQTTKTEVKCTVGAYGQTSNCETSTETNQKQSQRIEVLGRSTESTATAQTHQMVDASIDGKWLLLAASATTTLIGGYLTVKA